jgi:hypothetical protein
LLLPVNPKKAAGKCDWIRIAPMLDVIDRSTNFRRRLSTRTRWVAGLKRLPQRRLRERAPKLAFAASGIGLASAKSIKIAAGADG